MVEWEIFRRNMTFTMTFINFKMFMGMEIAQYFRFRWVLETVSILNYAPKYLVRGAPNPNTPITNIALPQKMTIFTFSVLLEFCLLNLRYSTIIMNTKLDSGI